MPQEHRRVKLAHPLRQMLDRGHQRGAGGVDAGTIAFMLAARKAGAKDAAALYRAAQDRVIVDLAGNVHGDMNALMADLKRENPAAFMRFTIDAGAGIGNARAGHQARHAAPADVARLALDAARSGR